ncbi:hypothetical protein ACFX2K_036183 [Malus domestica]
MGSSEFSLFQPSPKRSVLHKAPSLIADGFLFVGGASLALSVVWALLTFINPTTISFDNFIAWNAGPCGPDLRSDPPETTFYDDENLSYAFGEPVKDWDSKRKEWLKLHPSFAAGAAVDNRVLLVTGSQPTVCKNPVGDHLQMRLFKNKVDYCRIHGLDIFYNNVLLDPKGTGFWAKYPLLRAAMLAHPESEWIWWVDSDAVLTDMEFKLPLEKYKDHNLVVHGWWNMLYEQKSWTSLNAGVLLIRNCQWSLNLLDKWASMGPQGPDPKNWGKIQKSLIKDKAYPGSDDQSALIYLLIKEKSKWADKIYLESDYNLHGYWLGIVDGLDGISKGYLEIDREVDLLRRRHAEKVSKPEGSPTTNSVAKAALIGEENDTKLQPHVKPVTHYPLNCMPRIAARVQQWKATHHIATFTKAPKGIETPQFSNDTYFDKTNTWSKFAHGLDSGYDPAEPTFYDDPNFSYLIGQPVEDWDEKRKKWLLHHPSFSASVRDRVLLVKGSQSTASSNPVGDHLLLRFFKNKVDHC